MEKDVEKMEMEIEKLERELKSSKEGNSEELTTGNKGGDICMENDDSEVIKSSCNVGEVLENTNKQADVKSSGGASMTTCLTTIDKTPNLDSDSFFPGNDEDDDLFNITNLEESLTNQADNINNNTNSKDYKYNTHNSENTNNSSSTTKGVKGNTIERSSIGAEPQGEVEEARGLTDTIKHWCLCVCGISNLHSLVCCFNNSSLNNTIQ